MTTDHKPFPDACTALAQKVAAASADGVLEIRVSVDTGVPVQVTYHTGTERRQAFGLDVTDALIAAARAQDELHDYDLDPLPGYALGPHDSVIIRKSDAPLVDRLVWVHHAERTTDEVRKGERCRETELRGHDLLVERVDGLTIVPTVECSTCGRMGWITDGCFIPIARDRVNAERRHAPDRRENAVTEQRVS